ncbi:MAG TPA: phosphoglycerate kinase [Rhodospirillaceae bacterium]|nr:MAG: phosphoglycerate kinase [Alphaproteobacteria bacterium GWF2_58_20]HAU29408.1 phosphoglycerate kinase [Rhodospirillaceae bacterium]
MSSFNTIANLDVTGKTVLVRADLNVPAKDGKVTDTTRIDRFVPTVKALTEKGAKVVILSHFGRPKGGPDAQFSLHVVHSALETALGCKVAFGNDCIGPEAESVVRALNPGEVALLENLRFHPEEEKNDADFAKKLAALGDIYVNDAFSCAHRAHSSTEAIAHLLPNAAGLLMQAELEALGKALEHPEKPVIAIVGGAKISTKLDLLGNLVSKVGVLALGGGMANTFLFAQGVSVGASLCEKDMADNARAIMAKASACGCRILLPSDAVVATTLAEGVPTETVSISAIPENQMMLDIGPESIVEFNSVISECKTCVWNGPLGAFETKPFDAGTLAVARHAADRVAVGALLAVAGGGDTVSALAKAGVEDNMSYVSAAGGAFLEWLEGKELPGVKALAT